MTIFLVIISILLISFYYSLFKLESQFYKILILLISLTFGIKAYLMLPSDDMDLSVYYHIINNIKLFNGVEKIKYILSRGEYLTMIYFYLMSLIKNKSLVQFFPVVIIYFYTFIIFVKLYKKNDINNKTFILLTTMYLTNFQIIYTFSSFRYWLAITLFAYIVLNLNEFNRFHYPKYLFLMIPLLIHNGMLIYIGLYFLSFIKLKKSILLLGVITILLLLLYYPLYIINGSTTIYYGSSLFKIYISKFLMYFKPLFILETQYYYRIVQLIIFSLVTFLTIKNGTKLEVKNRVFKFYLLLLLFTSLSIPFYTLFFRNLEILRILFLIFLFKFDIIETKYKSFLNIVFFSFMIVGLALQTTTYKSILVNLFN